MMVTSSLSGRPTDPHAAPSRSTQVADEPAPRARVLIVDDSATFLHLLGDLVARTAGLEVAGAASNGEDAVRLAADLRPDVAIIDVNMPGLDGIGAAKQIKAGADSAAVVLISTVDPKDLPAEASEVGDIVLSKADLEPELLDRLWRNCALRGSHDS
jgi:DNA-binding NarL/FixJ family response regulator